MLRIILAVALLAFAAPEAAFSYPPENGQEQVSRQWPHQGLFARFDRAALRRGFQVYRQDCASCHSLRLVAYRDLTGIGFTLDEANAIAQKDMVTNADGKAGKGKLRPARLSDRIKAPFSNNQAARAANKGLLPPDLSQIIRAYKNGDDYLYSLLMDANSQRQLEENAFTYADATDATGSQKAADVVMFLAWAAEPYLEERKQVGIIWMLFFFFLTVFLYYLNRRIWAKLV